MYLNRNITIVLRMVRLSGQMLLAVTRMDVLMAKWWFGGVLLPGLVTIVVGGAVSLYLATVVSRFYLFYQTREAAAVTVYSVIGKVRELTRSTLAPYNVGYLAHVHIFSLEQGKHEMAGTVITCVFSEIF